MKTLLLSIVSIVMLAVPARAQTNVRFYIVPKVGTGDGQNPFRAKYLADPASDFPASATGAIAGRASCMDYGLEPIFFCGGDVTALEDASIAAQPDVFVIPAGSLDTLLTSINLTTTKNALEALKIPAGWITIAHTPRDVARFTGQLFQIFQRYHARTGASLFVGGITLDSTFGQLTVGQRTALQLVANDLRLDISGVTNGMTIRAALRALGPQLGSVSLLGVTF